MKRFIYPVIAIILILNTSFGVISVNTVENNNNLKYLTELVIEGPSQGRIGIIYNYSFYLTDNNDSEFLIQIDWGDGVQSEWLGPFESSEIVVITYSWAAPDTYKIHALARVCNNTDYSAELFVKIIRNLPPYPPRIDGPVSVKVGIEYKYKFTSWAIDYTDISMFVDWGDNTTSGWTQYYMSLEPVTFHHNWKEKGTYLIKAKARDKFGLESDWSVLKISMSKSNNLWLGWIEKFPLMQLLLEWLIK